MASPRLELRGLNRRFGEMAAVEDVSLSIAAGEVLCLLGPSGCGKSTTLRIVAGVEMQDTGEIFVDGEPISTLPPEQREVGLMFQDFALFPHLNVRDNIGYGIRARRERKARVEALLARMEMAQYVDAYPHELSGGEQQRVALARALAPKPSVMLMDEPFSGLDERLRDDVRDQTLGMLKEEGTAVLLVTHDPQEAMRMADKIALMRGGRIVQSGAPFTVFRSPVDLEAARFFSDLNVIEGVVEGAIAETPFGPFLVPGHADGTDVRIAIRPQHVAIDFDRPHLSLKETPSHGRAVRATVLRSRFLGQISFVEFTLAVGTEITATVPGVFLPKPGTPFNIGLPRRHCHVFPV